MKTLEEVFSKIWCEFTEDIQPSVYWFVKGIAAIISGIVGVIIFKFYDFTHDPVIPHWATMTLALLLVLILFIGQIYVTIGFTMYLFRCMRRAIRDV